MRAVPRFLTPSRCGCASLRVVALLWGGALLGGCGTGLACNNEFGPPPERALWCAPSKDLSKILFEVPPPPAPPPAPTVRCEPTLGARDCVRARPGTGS